MVDWESIVVGLVPGAIVAIISTVIAYVKDKEMKNSEDKLDALKNMIQICEWEEQTTTQSYGHYLSHRLHIIVLFQ